MKQYSQYLQVNQYNWARKLQFKFVTISYSTTFFVDVPFPKSFVPLCRKILTRLFRVFVHVYIHHFDRIVSIGAVSLLFQKIQFLK